MKEIFIHETEGKKEICILEEERLVEYYIEDEKKKQLEGNIYLGKIQNVIKGMQAAFVNIGEGKNAFIHIKDLLPKKDINDFSKTEEPSIIQILKPGDTILVQVKKDDIGHKGCKVSTHINFTGKYMVLLPKATFITTSQKITNGEEKERLTNIAKKYLPEGFGAIIRTSAMKKEETTLKEEIENLLKQWKDIVKKAEKVEKVPQKIYSHNGILEKLLLDMEEKQVMRIVTNSCDVKNALEKYFQKKDIIERKEDILSYYRLHKQIEEIQNRKVWLKCGGFITIDKTEALTAIDVNSGKYTGTTEFEDTIFRVNEEATIEIARQLRVRNISGIIIIDYIDMKREEEKEKMIALLKKELKKDRSKTQVEGFTKLNLIEMTRKHLYGK